MKNLKALFKRFISLSASALLLVSPLSIGGFAAVLQYLGNGDKFPPTERGKAQADCDGTAGISTKDAVTIQKFCAGVIDKL